MLVILLENINKIGKKNELKNVSPGYAKNFLFPKKLAIVATPELIKKAEEMKEIEKAALAKKEESTKKQAKDIEGKRFIIKTNAGDEGQLFEGISAKKIAEKVSENGFEIEEKQIIIEEPIKKIGEFKIKVVFDKGLESFINVVIDKENK